jgi:hypothetical protein
MDKSAQKTGVGTDYGPLFRLASEIGREADLGGLLLKILEIFTMYR